MSIEKLTQLENDIAGIRNEFENVAQELRKRGIKVTYKIEDLPSGKCPFYAICSLYRKKAVTCNKQSGYQCGKKRELSLTNLEANQPC